MSEPQGKEDVVQVWLPARTVERLRMGAKVAEYRSEGIRIDAELFCKLNPEPIKRGDWVTLDETPGLVVEVSGAPLTAAVLMPWHDGEIFLKVATVEQWELCDPPTYVVRRNRLLRAAGMEEVCAWD
jgi:hypothetical protein